MTLGLLQYEVFHVCSLRVVAPGVSFAPVGLLDMFNAGGAVKECAVTSDVGGRVVSVRVRVCGRFGAYYSREPARCLMDSAEVEFSYDTDTGRGLQPACAGAGVVPVDAGDCGVDCDARAQAPALVFASKPFCAGRPLPFAMCTKDVLWCLAV